MLRLSLLVFAALSRCWVAAAPVQPPAKPAVLFAGTHGGGCGFEVARKLATEFTLNRLSHPGLAVNPLTWEQVKRYNVLVLSGLGQANADMTLPPPVNRTLTTLRRYLEAGGGVLVFGTFGQMATTKPPQDAFLIPLGLTPLFDELPVDPEEHVTATAWNIEFAYTDRTAPSPVTADMKGLWYPVPPRRIGAQSHTVPFKVAEPWRVLVTAARTTGTRKGPLQANAPTAPGTFQGDMPLVASRSVGKGRLLFIGVTHEYLTGPHASTTLEGVVLNRGLRRRPSFGLALLTDALRWLAAPSRTAGVLGGASMDPALLRAPHKTVFGKPFNWSKPVPVPAVEPAFRGVIGARTVYSTGSATVGQWVTRAREKGLSFLVFLERFDHLSAAEFSRLKAECAQASTAAFAAIPGFTIDDEVGNHYFYFGTSFPYPAAKFLSEDGKTFRSYDAQLDPEAPHVPGQLSMTLLDYAYSVSSFKLTAGNYLFGRDAAPFADFFSNWDAFAVVTAVNGKVVENALPDYLRVVDSGQGPIPVVIDLMDSPAQLGASGWQTVLRLPVHGGQLVGGRKLSSSTPIQDYFDQWHFYPDNPSKIFVTQGPEIESWCYAGPRDYEGTTPGDFVWQNYRWQLRGRVKSAAGLREVAVYDGPTPFRRFRPRGKTTFEFVLDLTHDQQHNLVVVAEEATGRRAVSGEEWDRNHRLEEFMCSDRNNQLSYGYLTNSNGIGLLLGGNQSLATPYKRIAAGISPSGTFRNDSLLGAPAFDGAAGGDPNVWEVTSPLGTEEPVRRPLVNEARRLLHTGDIHLGEGVRQYSFADHVAVHNVWHTLWRTVPATDYTVTRRNSFFQVDPDSPLAVFQWRIDLRVKRDLPNRGFRLVTMAPRESRLWTLRGSDGTVYSGRWEDTPRSRNRRLTVPFDRGAYAAFLDSPLGGAAVFALTDGLQASFGLPRRNSLNLDIPADRSPTKQGDTRRVELLLLGIPRLTDSTRNLPGASTEVVERFYHQFALDGGPGGYQVRPRTGTVVSRRYLLRVEGRRHKCFSGTLTGTLVSSLPIAVSGLTDGCSSFLYDRRQKRARPVGMLTGAAWATVRLHGDLDLFLGQPVIADNPAVRLQLTQTGDDSWALEVHNPTDADIRTRLHVNPFFDPLKGKSVPSRPVVVASGSSVHVEL